MTRYRSPAIRRYLIRLVVLMSFYLVTLFIAVRAFRTDAVSGIAAYALAVLPALPVIGVFWAVMRLLVEEPDEFIRLIHVRQCLFATGFCLTVMTIWEFLQNLTSSRRATADSARPSSGLSASALVRSTIG